MSSNPGQKDVQHTSKTLEAVHNHAILDTVFLHFDNTQPEGSKALYRFSLVCKSFKGPALRQLWATLNSCFPLLNLLPQVEKINGKSYFYGKLAESAFFQYASYVRELHLITSGDHIVTFSGQVSSRIAKELNGSPLLPNLRHMIIHAVDDIHQSLIPLLLHPALYSLNFTPQATPSTELLQLVFRSLQEDSPALKKLTIALKDPFPSFSALIFDHVLILKHLRHLEICAPSTPFNPTDLARLGVSCPELVTLDLDICIDHVHLSGCPAAPEISEEAFANLACLHLTARNNATYHIDSESNYATALCHSWPQALITKLTALTVFVVDSYCWYDKLFEPLSQLSHFSSLKFTHTKAISSNFDPPEIAKVPSITSLVEAIWDVSSVYTNSSAESSELLEQLVEAGFKTPLNPKGLRTLILPSNMRFPFSLKDLEYVAKDAVGLERLSICVDSSKEAVGPISTAANFIPKLTLLHLRVSDQRKNTVFRPAEYRHLAEYLDTIFPNLESLGVYKDSRGDGGFHVEHWELIDHLRRKEKLIRSLSK